MIYLQIYLHDLLSDANECNDAFLNNCEQECVNTRGSFECGCRSGFAVDPNDRTKCIGKVLRSLYIDLILFILPQDVG